MPLDHLKPRKRELTFKVRWHTKDDILCRPCRYIIEQELTRAGLPVPGRYPYAEMREFQVPMPCLNLKCYHQGSPMYGSSIVESIYVGVA